VRTGSPTKRGCCRPLVVWSQAPHQYLGPCKKAYAIHTDQKTESADQVVRTSSPAIGWCCGLCGEKANFHAQRERERERERGCTTSQHIESRNGEDPRPARADGMYQADTVWNEHHSYRRAAHRGVGMIRETQRWRHDLSKHKLNMSVIETWSLETATETRQTSLLKSVPWLPLIGHK